MYLLTSLISLLPAFVLKFHEGLSITQQCYKASDNMYQTNKRMTVSTWPFLDPNLVLGQGPMAQFHYL